MMKLTSTALAALVLLSGAAAHAQSTKVYIVQLKDEPAASYQGTTAGYAATQAAAGTSFKSRTPAALAYGSYLRSKQLSVLSTVSTGPAISQFDTVFNGFSAVLTPAQAAQLSLNASVASVSEDQLMTPATISTPTFLGLTAAGGVWSQTDANGASVKGENMILGDVDLGIWPESPSYFDRVDGDGKPVVIGGTLAFGPPPATWHGGCVAGDAFNPVAACNNKLIGAKYYSANLLAGRTIHWTSFNSPRDDLGGATGHGGHGDHTASTAAGNDKVSAIVSGVTMGLASGMAPRARIASYKVCFTFVNAAATDGTGSQNSCSQADSVQAIDEAVRDGVNAINFSISGATSTTNDIVEQAFYRATLAGVFVAAAAGNSGPTNTVNHPGPWLATVAAATHDRLMAGDVTLGNGAKYTGASLNVNPLGSSPLIRAEDAALGAGSANLCFSDATAAAGAGQVTLDPAKVAGKVVVCTRGTNARVDKSLAVLNAGGVGMVLADNGAGLVAEVHSVPTVHVSTADGAAIKAYAVAAAAGATASESAFYFGHQPAPTIAAFSGRGPDMADANILKPDLAAPGVGVIASVTPAYTQAQRNQLSAGTLQAGPAWASYDGTSMATPHVTGIALLLKQAHPTWSPAAIKSAMMTTAFDTLDDGLTGMQNGKLPWSQGSGFISPNKAIDPGLVYDMGKADFVKYQCLTQKALVSAADCSTYGTLDQSFNLNLPTITVGVMTGPTTVKRSVTNVGTSSATYTSTAAVTSLGVAVTPASLTLAPGATGNFTVTLTPTASTPKFTWLYGSLNWTDGTHVVHSPVQVQLGTSITAPADFSANTVSGSRLFSINTGFAGHSNALKGIKDVTLGAPRTLTANANIDIEAACKAGATLPSVAVYSMTVPAGAIVARFALRQADVSGATDDNDLTVVSPNGTAKTSGSGTSHETVELLNPAAGTYKVCVQAYAAASGVSTHSLSSWIVSPGDAVTGAFNVLMPSTVYAGGTASVGLSWSGLLAGHRYVGGAQYLDAANNAAAATALYIDTTPGTPLEVPSPTAAGKVGTVKN
ncbi:MAG: S8 family serine peptidase [Betaproteobacteria bacterium]